MHAAGVGVHRADGSDATVRALAEILVDCVEGGASVGFMQPLTQERAEGHWRAVVESAARGERLLLVARDEGDAVVGTVQVIMAWQENQPHRGEISKMLVRRRARRRGVGAALMRAAEREAVTAGRTLLVLDTASADAMRLYERLGWQRVGVIPRYALLPQGGHCDTVVYYRDL